MGDGWEYEITFLGTTDDEELSDMQLVHSVRPGQEVICLEAEGHPLAGDCGGFSELNRLKVCGYDMFVQYLLTSYMSCFPHPTVLAQLVSVHGIRNNV